MVSAKQEEKQKGQQGGQLRPLEGLKRRAKRLLLVLGHLDTQPHLAQALADGSDSWSNTSQLLPPHARPQAAKASMLHTRLAAA